MKMNSRHIPNIAAQGEKKIKSHLGQMAHRKYSLGPLAMKRE